MARHNTSILAEYAAVSSPRNVKLDDLAEELFISFLRTIVPLYQEALYISSVSGEGKRITADELSHYSIDEIISSLEMDEDTVREMQSISEAMTRDLTPVLLSSCIFDDINNPELQIGLHGSIGSEDRASFMCGFALRTEDVTTCDINGVRVNSKLPISASFTFNFKYSIKILNDARGSRVGIGYVIGIDNVSVRSGMDLKTWNRLGQISSVQKGVGEAFGAQYQVYLFTQIRSFALGYPTVGFDIDGGLPVSPLSVISSIEGFNVEEREGA